MHLSKGDASIYLGDSCYTLRRWDKSNKLIPYSLTPSGHRRYSFYNLKNFSGVIDDGENKKVIAYTRVSSPDQEDDLKRQSFVLNKFHTKKFPAHGVRKDFGRGMNYRKKGLKN